MPIRRGAGWAWGPRSDDRAFGIRIGTGTYHESKKTRSNVGGIDAYMGGGAGGERDLGHNEEIELGVMGRRNTGSDSSRANIMQPQPVHG